MNLWCRFAGVIFAMSVLAACVPSGIESQCKRKAIQSGYGKCSVNKGKQNAYGVWVVKLDCSRAVASCLNNTAGRVSVSTWTSMDDHLYQN